MALVLAGTAGHAQQKAVVVLDAARGGDDAGATLAGGTPEKQVTLQFAQRLRTLLVARGFDVVMTREDDAGKPAESRAALANGAHAAACISIYASSTGQGVHLFTTSARPANPGRTVRWDEVQASHAGESTRLLGELGQALTRANVPVTTSTTWLQPLDNFACPAVALELASAANGSPASTPAVQTQVAGAVAGALLYWRGQHSTADAQP